MLRPLVLTGGPAVGKSTCGRILARSRPRSAFIDADDIRQLVVSDAATLWSGPEGERQHDLAARNSSGLAAAFLTEGFEVVIADVLTSSSLAVFREALPGCLVVKLDISLGEARARAATRQVYLADEEFEWLHRMTREPLDADVMIQVDDLSLDEQTARIEDAWRSSS